MSERHVRRLRDAYAGVEAVVDRRRGKAPSNTAPEKLKDWLVEQYVTRYLYFTPRHFHEELVKRGVDYGYSWTKSMRGVSAPP